MDSKKYVSYLSYNSVDVYFIFSFAFEFEGTYEEIFTRLQELEWKPGAPPDRKGRPPFLHIQRRVGTGRSKKFISTSISGQLINPNDSLCKLYYYEKDRTSQKYYRDEFEVGLEAWCRIFENGAGSLTFKISIDEDVNFRRIYEAHSLSQRVHKKKETHAKVELEGQKRELFSLFSQEIRALESKINKKKKLVILQDQEIMDLRITEVEAQNPYVLSVIELDESRDLTQFFHCPQADMNECKELVAILLRLVYPIKFFQNLSCNINNIRIPHELLVNGKHLHNYSWDSRSLMIFSRTSSLFACYFKNRLPDVLIKQSFLDILEIIRTRWHMSILINAQLDLDLENFRPVASRKNLRLLENLNKRRKRFASFLHDPLAYSFEGGSVSEISKVASEDMQLRELRNMTIEKFSTLDKLHSDQIKIMQLRRFG